MAPRVSRLPYLLLGLMTLATFGGPVVIGLVLSGGPSPSWPPDRAVEWWTLGIVSGVVVILMGACVGIGLANLGSMGKSVISPEKMRQEGAPTDLGKA